MPEIILLGQQMYEYLIRNSEVIKKYCTTTNNTIDVYFILVDFSVSSIVYIIYFIQPLVPKNIHPDIKGSS